MRVPLSRPDIGPLERRYVDDAITGGWISGSGGYVKRFEEAVQARLARSHAVAMSSGTQSLEILLQALGVGRDDEVVVPALTFAAPAAAVASSGALPVLADITEETWTIDPAAVASLITPKTKAIIAVDVMGHPCDYQALEALGIPIIEDAAEAHGSRYRGTLTGKFGVASAFSFHANKAITTGEGGCVVTDDTELAEKVRLISNHGMSASRPYHHDVVGRNGRMTNLSAAVGLGQMERWEDLITGRFRTGTLYESHLPSAGLTSRPVADWAFVTPWLYTVLLTGRDRAVTALRDAGIDARAVWPAISDLPIYKAGVRRPCPVASYISARAMWLPTWSAMGEEVICEVARHLRPVIEQVQHS